MQWGEQLHSYGNKRFCHTTATGQCVMTSFGSHYHSHGIDCPLVCQKILYSCFSPKINRAGTFLSVRTEVSVQLDIFQKSPHAPTGPPVGLKIPIVPRRFRAFQFLF
jgi:hypothetical protein